MKLIRKDLRHTFICYIVDEGDWDNTYECLAQGRLVMCGEEALYELERMIEEFDEDKEDFRGALDDLSTLINNPKDFLSKVKEGYKEFYCRCPLGYTISIE